MSHLVNEAILEEASDYIDLYTGTIAGLMLERAVAENDLEQVYNLVLELKEMERMDEEIGEYPDVF